MAARTRKETPATRGARGGKASTESEIALRVVVLAPPPGVAFCVQGKLCELLDAKRSTGGDLVFDVTARVDDGDPPRILGDVAQGPPATRFLYVCSGTSAGDVFSPWTRRAKLPFATVTKTLVQRARKGGRLVATIAGVARDGGPACATVPLVGGGWKWQA
jgi:hypothetical protein